MLALRDKKEHRALEIVLDTHLTLAPFGLALTGHVLDKWFNFLQQLHTIFDMVWDFVYDTKTL